MSHGIPVPQCSDTPTGRSHVIASLFCAARCASPTGTSGTGSGVIDDAVDEAYDAVVESVLVEELEPGPLKFVNRSGRSDSRSRRA